MPAWAGMGDKSKSSALLLIMLIATSSLALLTVMPTNAQTTQKPSAPEFTYRFVDHSYDVPLTCTYETDPYSGKEHQITHGGYHVDNRTIEIWVKNQPHVPYGIPDNTWLYYNVTYKGHYEEGWKRFFGDIGYNATDTDYTVLILGYGVDRASTDSILQLGEFPVDTQIDVRIQALVGYYVQVDDPPSQFGAWHHNEFRGEYGDWSEVQTISVPNSPSTSPTYLPFSFLFSDLLLDSVLIAVVVLSVAVVCLLVYVRRMKSQLLK
jgi:hypothetical protein